MWDVDAVPDPPPSAVGQGLPTGAFATCGSDGSVRVWALGPTPADSCPTATEAPPRSPGGGPAGPRVVPAGRELQAAAQLEAAAGAADGSKAAGDGGAAEGRCVRVSPDGRWLAVGDRAGNLRVHALAPGLELQVGLRSGVDALAAGSSRIQVQPNDRIKMCLQPYGEALLAVWRGQDLCPRICFILHHQCPEH